MTFDVAELHELAQLLRAAARAEIMPRFRHLGPADIRTKSSPTDLVTAADEAAERLITQGLHRLFPGCLVVGEEAAAADAGLLDQLPGAELAFTVDPVDGTANYAAGLPLFGVMAAALVRGQVVGAVIHDPVVDELSLALAGQGAWRETPDGEHSRLHVAPPVPTAQMTGSASWRYMRPELRARVLQGLPQLGTSWDHRCAAHEYRMLAGGFSHFVVFNRLMPWDHLPGWLLHQEAGGFSAQFDGSPYRPGQVRGGLVCTPDEASYAALIELLGLR